ncbi:MAG: sulfotransferase [Solirubrobacteraceae bacterium]
MGSGRSGSTILGVTLGNCEDMFYAGELDTWLARSGTPILGGLERTRFWNAIREEVDGASELFGGNIRQFFERSSILVRVDRWPTRRRLRTRYRRTTESLYQAISRSAGASYIVDTSHFPLRGRELQNLDGIDLYLIFLFRDPQGVVSSFARLIRRQDIAERRLRELSTNANLWITHLLSVLVFKRHRRDRRMLVRHEDFLTDPEGTLQDILRRVGSGARIPDLASLKTGVPLKGNRLIRSEMISVKGRAARAQPRSALTATLQWPWTFLVARLTPVANGRAESDHGRRSAGCASSDDPSRERA